MKLFSKKYFLTIISFVSCYLVACLFCLGCYYNFDDTSSKFYYIENDIRYFCDKDKKEAWVNKIFVKSDTAKTNEFIYDFDDNLEAVAIPETVKGGEYKVVGIEGQQSYYGAIYRKSSIAPDCWKNVKKVYLPYSLKDIFYENAFKAETDSLYVGRLTIIVPNMNSYKLGERKLFSATDYTFATDNDYILATVPQKHYDMVVEQYGTLETPPTETVEEYVQNLVTPNYVFNFNYEGAPNEGIYWIDLIEDENTVFVLPTNPTREGYIFGGWYTEETCATEWDSKMTPTAKVKNMYAKWVPAETEQPTESEETAE